MRRLLSGLLAVVVLALGFASTQVRAGDFYDWGVRKEWHDANGEVIGFYYKPCPENGGEAVSWGVQEGRATVVERWMCDPIVQPLCWKWWPAGQVWIQVPCE